MKLTRPVVALVLVLITGAFLGLLSIEFYLLRQAYDAKLQAFERNVQGALDSVVKTLEERETLNRVVKLTVLARSDAGETYAVVSIWEDGRETDANQLLLRAYRGGSRVRAAGLRVIVQLQQPGRMKLVSFGADTKPGNEIRILADPRNADASLAGDGVVVFDEFRPAGRYDLPLSC